MVRRVMIAVALVAGVLLVVPASPASAHGVHGGHGASLACPTGDQPLPVTSDVRLSHDLHCTGTLVEWDIAPGVTVDLGGHTVTVDAVLRCQVGNPPCTFQVGGGTLRNGGLIGADVNVDSGHAQRLHIHQALAEVTGSGEITRSTIDQGQVVIERGGQLTRSWVTRGQGVLLRSTDAALSGFRIADNVIADNAGAGIGLRTIFFGPDDVSGTIKGNWVAGNGGPGISLSGDLRALGAVDISGNWALWNHGTGISVHGDDSAPTLPLTGGPVTLTHNRASFNDGNGIDASWMTGQPTGIVDGGKNRARGNHTAPDCIGVTCSGDGH